MIPRPSDLAREALADILPADFSPNESSTREKKGKKAEFQEFLGKNGLGPSEVARNIAEVANFSEDYSLRLKANEVAMRAHEILGDEKQSVTPVINILIRDSTVNVAEILTPRI